jgi:hypothetical protein
MDTNIILYISDFTEGEQDEFMLSNNSIQPEWRSNYKGDYKGTTRPVCTRDLLCWSFQVARGMDYLASRKVRIFSYHIEMFQEHKYNVTTGMCFCNILHSCRHLLGHQLW